MNPWKDYPAERITAEEFDVYIEISAGSKNKYELDKETGLLHLDRILYTSTHYPQNYGFIPRTFAEDNDPLDVLFITSETLLPCSVARARPIGMVRMIDQGLEDAKILAVCPNDPLYKDYKDIHQFPEHMTVEIEYFFQTYKVLEGKDTLVPGIYGREEAIEVVDRAIKAFKEKFPDD